MRKRPFYRRLVLAGVLGLGAVPLTYLAVPAVVICAEAQTVSADGVYELGGLDESLHVAKIRARLEAWRQATEQAGIYIAAQTATSGNVLTQDEVSTLASAVLSVTEESYKTDAMGGQGMKVTCHIEATIDASKLADLLRERQKDAARWAAAQERNKSLREQIAKVQAENKTLQEAYANAKTQMEKQKLRLAAAQNQNAAAAAAWRSRGDAALGNNSEEAIRDYTEAIRLDPKDAMAYIGR